MPSIAPSSAPSCLPKVSVLLLSRPSHEAGAAAASLARQTVAAADYEIVSIATDDGPAHAAYNRALLAARGGVVTVCAGALVLPDNFIASVIAAFHTDAPADGHALLLQHRLAGHDPDPQVAPCLSMRRGDAICLGGFDEHPDFDAGDGAPQELGWRLLNAGIEGVWHTRVTLEDAGVRVEPVPSRAAAEVLADGRLLPRQEHPALHAARLARRRFGSDAEARLAAPIPTVSAKAPSAPTPTDATLDWRDIPVFIVNRNRLSAMQRLIDWLLAAGTRRVVIMDNASDYPPLLRYYDALPEGVKLMRLEQNHGPYVLWQQKVHEVLDTPYVVTDSDVVPCDFCPADLIGHLLATLRRYPDAKKVGCALRIDNLPDGYVEADTVRKWESQFWEQPIAPGLFAAPIDTTFALYPARGEFTNAAHNIRVGHPYIAEHTPWYADESTLSAEERYYREHTSATFSNWSVAKKDSWVRRSERVAAFDRRARVLHLDGGREHIPGWINTDWDPRSARTTKLALADDSVDGIHLSHVLEGVRDAQALFDELFRVARPGAMLFVRVAHGARNDVFVDPAQQRLWTEGSFAHSAWQLESVRLVVPEGATAQDLHEQRGLVREMVVTLRALKPARPGRGRHPATQPPLQLVNDGRIAPAFAAA